MSETWEERKARILRGEYRDASPVKSEGKIKGLPPLKPLSAISGGVDDGEEEAEGPSQINSVLSSIGSVAAAPFKLAKTGAELALSAMDTGGRVVREGITSTLEGRDAELKDAFFNDNERGNVDDFLAATSPKNPDELNPLKQEYTSPIAGRALDYAGKLGSLMSGGVGSDFIKLAGTDPASFVTGGAGGVKGGLSNSARILGRAKVALTPAMNQTLSSLLQLGKYDEARAALKSFGAQDNAINAIAGKNMEFIDASRPLNIGVTERFSFDPMSKLADAAHAVTGKNIPENLINRGVEAVVRKLPGSANMPRHQRDLFQAARSTAYYGAQSEMDNLSKNVLPSMDGGAAARSEIQRRSIDTYRDFISKAIPDAPPEVINAADNIFDSLGPAKTPVGKMYDVMLRVFKRVRLHGNPAWSVLNGIEDAMKAHVFGIDASSYLKSFNIESKPANHIVINRPNGDHLTAGQLKRLFKQAGITEANSGGKWGISGAASKGEDWAVKILSGGISGAVAKADAMRELFMKRAFLIDRLKKGVPMPRAIREMQRVMFDVDLPAVDPHIAKGQAIMQKILPFVGYTLRSAVAVPQLILNSPQRAMLPVRAAQALDAQDEMNVTPPKHMRQAGVTIGASPMMREAGDAYLNALGGGLEADQNFAMPARGQMMEPFSAMENLVGLDGGWNPMLGIPFQMTTGIDSFGEHKEDPLTLEDAARQFAGSYVGNLPRSLINAGLRRSGITPHKALLGMSEYKDPQMAENNELLSIPNLLLPGAVKVADPSLAKKDQKWAKSKKKRADRRVKKKKPLFANPWEE